MDEDRLIDIETKITYQEHTIKELNDVVYEQQKQIDLLKRNYDLLFIQLKNLSDFARGSKIENEKPPHY